MIKFLIPFCFVVLFSSSFCAQNKTDEIVPVEVLFKKNNQHTFTISPNGKYFTEVVENNLGSGLFDVRSELYIVDIENYELLHTIPLDVFSLDGLYWLTNNRILYESKGAIMAIDIDGSNRMEIVGRRDMKKVYTWRTRYKNMRYNSVMSLMHDKKHQILIQTHDTDFHAAIKEVNVFTGAQYTVIDAKLHKVNHWVTDMYGEVRLAVKYSERGMSYYKYDKVSKKLSPFNIVIDGRNYSLTIDANSYLGQNITFEGFGIKPDVIYLTSNIGHDKRKLIIYNIESEQIEKVLVEDINCDVKDLDGQGINFIYDYNKVELAGVKYSGLLPQYKWYSDVFSDKITNLNALYPKFFNEIIDSDSSGDRLLIHQWSDVSSGNIGVYNATDNSYALMFHFNQELDNYALSKSKSIVVSARDNYKLPGYLNLPVDYDGTKKFPLVVIPHGGPWARDYWGLEEFSQYFATRGYVVLRINFRGSTGFGKSHALAGISSMDKIMINDIADATQHVLSGYNINKDEVFMFGHSYGGYATYMSLLKYSDLFVSGVSLSAPTDIKAWMKMQKKEKNYYSYEFWNTALGSNKSAFLDEISPINFTKNLNNPLLIFHGRWDKTVPVDQAERMVDQLKSDKKSVEFEILNNEGHSIEDSNTLGYVLEQSDTFFKKTIKSKE